VLLPEDAWVGDAVSSARIAYETWTALLRGEIKIQPEGCPSLLGGSYSNLFTDYAKAQFLSAAAVLHRGFFKMEKGVLVKKKVARRMLQNKAMSEEQMDELLKLAEPLHDFRDKDQHKENPDHPPIWSLILDGTRPTICTVTLENPVIIEPSALSALYELLRSLEPTIGRVAFSRIRLEKQSSPSE
jgi:hypothetical protein